MKKTMHYSDAMKLVEAIRLSKKVLLSGEMDFIKMVVRKCDTKTRILKKEEVRLHGLYRMVLSDR